MKTAGLWSGKQMGVFESTSLFAHVSVLSFSGIIPKKTLDQVWSYFPLPRVLMRYHGIFILKRAAIMQLSPSFGRYVQFTSLQVGVSGVVPIKEESEQGKAKSKAGMKRKWRDGKGLIWCACIKNSNKYYIHWSNAELRYTKLVV